MGRRARAPSNPPGSGAEATPMLIENPFWIRERRRLARRTAGEPAVTQPAAGCFLGLLLVMVVCVAMDLLDRVFTEGRPTYLLAELRGWLVALHALACMVTGGFAGDTVFAAEARRGTLEQVLALPYSRPRLLLLKLALPAWWVCLVSFTPLPVYAVASVLYPEHLAFYRGVLWLPPILGVAVLAVSTCAGAASGTPQPQPRGQVLLGWLPPLFGARRREDPWAAAEIRWLTARGGNPVLIRDLRGHLHHQSLRRDFMWSPIIVGVFAGLVWLAGYRPQPAWLLFMWHTFSAPGTRAGEMWQKEWDTHTLTHLLLTPLSSAEIVRGRLLAGLIAGWGGAAGLLLPAAGFALYIILNGDMVLAPVLVGVLPLAGAAVIAEAHPDRQKSGCGHFVLLIAAGGVGFYLYPFGPGPIEPIWGKALLAGLAGVVAMCLAYRAQVASLAALRRADVDLEAAQDAPAAGQTKRGEKDEVRGP